MPTSLIDIPLTGNTNEDLFDIDGYQRALVEFIKGAEAPLTIALQGEWGSGKTSLMNYLKANLTQNNATYYGIEINTWHYSMFCTPEQAVGEILCGILKQMGVFAEDQKEFYKKIGAISQQVLKFASTASLNILGQTIGIDEVGSSLAEASKSCKNGKSNISVDDIRPASSIIEKLKTNIRNEIDKTFSQTEDNSNNSKAAPKGFLFFIDDLDRIDPPLAVKILELLKNIFDLPRCIFVLAIDYDVVVKGLKPKFGELTAQNEREFRSFFDKIIQLPFSMPISSYKIDKFLIEALKKLNFFLITNAKTKTKKI